jgi:hypothetical protein
MARAHDSSAFYRPCISELPQISRGNEMAMCAEQ